MEHNINSKVCGFYKLEAVKLDKDGNEISRRIVADWFPNLVTNGGLNRMGAYDDYLNYCQVGTGSTTPNFTDTALVSRVANHNTVQSNTKGFLSTSPYYCWNRFVYRFNEGVAAGNLSEIGVGWATTGSLLSRALILDALGDPTTITILSDETLDVTYEFRLYPKLTDNTGTVVFTGNIGGTYDYIWRAAGLNGYWDFNVGASFYNLGYNGSITARTGDIGSYTTVPSGTPSQVIGCVAQAYVADSFERKFNCSLTLAQGNFNIRNISGYLGPTFFQMQFNPAIPKTSNDVLTFIIKHSWGRL